jgi:AcrR family transcriptional regulator
MAGAVGESEDTREEIMVATYRALKTHGYANLTMQNIADEFGKSKSLLHYHYETKDDLMLAFLEYTIGWLGDRVEEETTDDPEERLERFVERLTLDRDEEGAGCLTLLELRLQAAHNEAFRERLAANYQADRDALAAIVADGVEREVFRPVDPEETAELLLAALEGARMAHVTLGLEGVSERTAEALRERVLACLKRPQSATDRNA